MVNIVHHLYSWWRMYLEFDWWRTPVLLDVAINICLIHRIFEEVADKCRPAFWYYAASEFDAGRWNYNWSLINILTSAFHSKFSGFTAEFCWSFQLEFYTITVFYDCELNSSQINFLIQRWTASKYVLASYVKNRSQSSSQKSPMDYQIELTRAFIENLTSPSHWILSIWWRTGWFM